MAHIHPRLKKIVKWIAGGGMAVLCLVSLLLFLLTLPPGERLIKSILESQIESNLYQEVTIGKLETNLLSRLVLTGLRIHDREDSVSQAAIGVQRITVHYNPWRLLHRELKLLSVIIDSVTVTATRDAANRSNLAVIDSLDIIFADTTALPIAITIDTLALNGLGLELRDDGAGLQASVKDVGVHLATDNGSDFRYYVRIPSTVGVYDSIPLTRTSFFCSGVWREDRLIIEKLGGSSAGMTVQGDASYAPADSAMDLRLVIAGSPDSLVNSVATRFGWPTIITAGEMRCVVQAGGTVGRPQVQLAADLPPIRTDALQTGDSRLLASLENDTLIIDSSMIRLFDGTVRAQGRIAMDTTFWSDLRVQLSSLRLEQLSRMAPELTLPISGRVDGEIAITGIITDPATLDLTSDWRVRDPRYEGRSYPDIVARASVKNGLANINIDGAGVALEADGRLQGEQITGDYRITIPDLAGVARLANIEDVGGTLSISGTFSGNQNRPAVHATLVGERIQYQNLPLDSLYARIHFVDESLYVEKLAFAGDWNGSDSADAFFDLPSLRGALSYTGTASGPLMGIDGHIEIQMSEFGIDEKPRMSGQTLATIEDSRIVILQSQLAMDSLRMGVDGQYDLVDSTASLTVVIHQPSRIDVTPLDGIATDSLSQDTLGRLTINAGGIGSDNLAVLFDAEVNALAPLVQHWSDTLDVDGNLAVAGRADGTLENPQLDVTLAVRRIRYETWAMDSLFAHVRMGHETVWCDSLTAYAPGARAYAMAEVPIHMDTLGVRSIDMTRTGYGRIQIPAFDLALAGPFLPPEASLSGDIEADLEWTGPLNSPVATGWALVTDANFVRSPDSPPVQNVRARISFSDSTVTLDSLRGELRGFPFDVSGWAAILGPEAFRGEIDCDLAQLGTGHVQGSMLGDSIELSARTKALRLAALSPFVPAVQGLKGSIDTELRVYGSRESPRADGRLTISDFAFCHPRIDSCLSDGRVVLSFSGDRTQLDTLLMRYGTGWITGSGYVIHPNLTPSEFDFSIGATNLRYDRPKFAKVTVDSMALRFRQTGDESVLTGDISMGESRVLARIKPQALAPWARTVERAGPAVPPMLENTRLDIRLRQSDSLWIDNNFARIRLAAELTASGNISQPVIAGRVGIEEGYLLYLDRRFVVKEGVLLFSDPEKISPDIVLRADTRVTSYSGMLATPYVITLAVEGTPEDLTVDIYSDPPADHADILSLLTVGATRTELTGSGNNGEGGTKDVLLARGGELASQRVAGFMTKRVGSRLGLDEVTVEGNLFSTDGRDDARLLATRHLGERLKLTYSTAVGHLNDQAVRLNYSLTRRFSLEGQTTQQGKSLLGIEYSLPIK